MRQNLANSQTSRNGSFSEETTTAILDKYLHLHGPCTDERLIAVLQAATDAAVSLACFQMTMRGDLIPELKAGTVVFRKTSADSALEHCGDIMRQLLKEACL